MEQKQTPELKMLFSIRMVMFGRLLEPRAWAGGGGPCGGWPVLEVGRRVSRNRPGVAAERSGPEECGRMGLDKSSGGMRD